MEKGCPNHRRIALAGVNHEYATIPGVRETSSTILLIRRSGSAEPYPGREIRARLVGLPAPPTVHLPPISILLAGTGHSRSPK